MDNGIGADGDVVSDFRGVISLDLSNVDNRSVTNARLGANLDAVDVSSNRGSVPYTTLTKFINQTSEIIHRVCERKSDRFQQKTC